jgi:high-affinity iron transporter
MSAALLLTLREGFEAALIVSITMAYLKRVGRYELIKYVWLAIFAAAALTSVVGMALFLTVGEFEGRAEEIFEGVVMIFAAVVITHVWRRFSNIRRSVQQNTDQALLNTKVGRGIFLAAFVAVLIEGLEIVLFLLASAQEGTVNIFVGAVMGLILAALAGWLFYQTNRMGDAILFFYVLGVLLIFIAAGLLAKGIHEFQEANLIPIYVEHIWDYSNLPIIGEKAGVGKFLKSAIGYDSNPGFLQFCVWVTYLSIAGWYFNIRNFSTMLIKRIR